MTDPLCKFAFEQIVRLIRDLAWPVVVLYLAIRSVSEGEVSILAAVRRKIADVTRVRVASLTVVFGPRAEDPIGEIRENIEPLPPDETGENL